LTKKEPSNRIDKGNIMEGIMSQHTRTKTIGIRTKPSELNGLEALALKAGVPLATFIHGLFAQAIAQGESNA
jgi:hypothetical protein